MKFVNLIFFLFLFICYNSFSQEQVVGYVIVKSDTDIEVFSDSISTIPADTIIAKKYHRASELINWYFLFRENQVRLSVIDTSKHRFCIMISDSVSYWIDNINVITFYTYIVQPKSPPKAIVRLQTKNGIDFYEDSISIKPIKQIHFTNCNSITLHHIQPIFYICDNNSIELLEFYSTDTSQFRIQVQINDSIQYWIDKQDILHYDLETFQVLNSIILPYIDSIYYSQLFTSSYLFLERNMIRAINDLNKIDILVNIENLEHFIQNNKNIFWPHNIFYNSFSFNKGDNIAYEIESENLERFLSVRNGDYEFDHYLMTYMFSKPYFVNENICLLYYTIFADSGSGIYEFIILEKKNNEWEKIYTADSGVF